MSTGSTPTDTPIEVVARSTPEGWVFLTADEFEDPVAGPFPTKKDLFAGADLSFRVVPPVNQTIRSLKSGDLFRVGDLWYRLLKREGRMASVDVVGSKTTETLPLSTVITQISVLSMD